MRDAYAWTMPAADPFSALTDSSTGARPVRTSAASKSCGIVNTIVAVPAQQRVVRKVGRRRLPRIRKCPTPRAASRCRATRSCGRSRRHRSACCGSANVAAFARTSSCTIGTTSTCASVARSRTTWSTSACARNRDAAHRLFQPFLEERVLAASRSPPCRENHRLAPQIREPVPFSMMLRAISTNHRAGTTYDTHCSAAGMLSIGR